MIHHHGLHPCPCRVGVTEESTKAVIQVQSVSIPYGRTPFWAFAVNGERGHGAPSLRRRHPPLQRPARSPFPSRRQRRVFGVAAQSEIEHNERDVLFHQATAQKKRHVCSLLSLSHHAAQRTQEAAAASHPRSGVNNAQETRNMHFLRIVQQHN